MDDIVFLDFDEVLAIHHDQLKRHGGQDGFIDEGVVHAAIARPRFTAQYNNEADLADLAADYMYGFSTTQGFLDANKRTGLACCAVFLRRNGWKLNLSDQLMYIVAMAVAKNEIDRDALAEILHTHMTELSDESD
jgi:death on curing protein